MKILICDDDQTELSLICDILEIYKNIKKVGFIVTTTTSSIDLVERVKLEKYDLLILDIIMPKFDGMQAAHEIRSFDKSINIIFLSSSPEFAVKSYEVKAYTYLLKPLNKESLFPILDALCVEFQKKEECITLKTKTGIARILLSELSYVEVMGKNLSFHMCNSTIHQTTATLSKYQDMLLSQTNFLRTHRSFIVNLTYMKEVNEQTFVSIDGATIPISRRLFPIVKHEYIKSLFHLDKNT